jgi:hypothetical protein
VHRGEDCLFVCGIGRSGGVEREREEGGKEWQSDE